MPAKNDAAGQETLGLTLVRAMIAAARADGRLDAKESRTIYQRIESLGLDPEDQALLVAEMGHPVGTLETASGVGDGIEPAGGGAIDCRFVIFLSGLGIGYPLPCDDHPVAALLFGLI
jgi:hypothetical protein